MKKVDRTSPDWRDEVLLSLAASMSAMAASMQRSAESLGKIESALWRIGRTEPAHRFFYGPAGDPIGPRTGEQRGVNAQEDFSAFSNGDSKQDGIRGHPGPKGYDASGEPA